MSEERSGEDINESEESMLEVANTVNEVVADSISSLILILVGLQERNKAPNEPFYAAIDQVVNACETLANVAHSFADEDYAEYPELAEEIHESASVVDNGKDSLKTIKDSLRTTKNLSAGYENLVNTIRDVGASCIRMLQTIFGASFKRIEFERNKLDELKENTDTKLLEEDPEKLCEGISEYCSTANNVAEYLRELASNEQNQMAKEELLQIADEIENASNEVIEVLNKLFEDPENEELIKEFEESKKALETALEKAKQPVKVLKEVVEESNAVFEQQQEAQKASISKQMTQPIDHDKTNEIGCDVMRDIDRNAESVFWADNETFIDATTNLKTSVPKYMNRLRNEAKVENSNEKLEVVDRIEKEFIKFLDDGRNILKEQNVSDEQMKAFIDEYNNFRDIINEGLNLNQCNDSDKPEKPSFGEEEDVLVFDNKKESKCTLPEDEMKKIKKQYQNVDAIEYAVENKSTNIFVDGFKAIQQEIPVFINENIAKARNEKDIKLNKICNELSEELRPLLIDSKTAIQSPSEESKKLSLDKTQKYKAHFVDMLVNKGMTKDDAIKYLEEKERNDDTIKELQKFKEGIISMQNNIEENDSAGFVNGVKETVQIGKKCVEMMKKDGEKDGDSIKKNFDNVMNEKINSTVTTSKEVLRDPKNEEKRNKCNEAFENIKKAIDTAILLEGGEEEDTEIKIKEVPDSDLIKKVKDVKKDINDIENSIYDDNNFEMIDVIEEIEQDVNELIKEMKDDKRCSEKEIEEIEKQYDDVYESLKDTIKNGNDDLEKSTKAIEELEKLDNLCGKLLDKEGKKEKEIEKKAKELKKGIKTVKHGVIEEEPDEVTKGRENIKLTLPEFKETVERKAKKEGKEEEKKKLIEELQKEIQQGSQEATMSLKDKGNEEKEKNCCKTLDKCCDLIDEIIEKENKEDKKNKGDDLEEKKKEINQQSMKERTLIDKLKEELYSNNPDELASAIHELEEVNQETIKLCKEDDLLNKSKGVIEESGKSKEKLEKAIEAITEAKKSNDEKDLKKAIEKLEDLEEICEEIEKATGKKQKKVVEEAKDLKKELNKLKYEIEEGEELKHVDDVKKQAEKLIKELNNGSEKQKQLAKELEKLMKELEKDSMKDMNDEKNKKKLLEDIEKIKELIDDVMISSGEMIPTKPQNNLIVEDTRNLKNEVSKMKEAINEKDPSEIEKTLLASEVIANELIKEMEEKKKKTTNEEEKKELTNLINDVKQAIEESKIPIDNCRVDIENIDKRKKAEKKCDDIEKVCNLILGEEGKTVKKSGILTKKVKDDLKKIQEGIKNKDENMISEGKKQLQEDKKELFEELNKEEKETESKELKKLIENVEDELKSSEKLIDSVSKDLEDKDKKEKTNKQIKKTIEALDDLLVYTGEGIYGSNKKEKANKSVLKTTGKIKNDTTKIKEDMWNENEKQLEEAIKDLKEDGKKLKKECKKLNTKEEKEAVKIADKIEDLIKDVDENSKQAMKDSNERKKQEKRLDEIDELCDSLRELNGRPTKEGAKKAKKMKESIKKMESAMNNSDNPLFVEGAKDMKAYVSGVTDALTDEAAKENKDKKDELAEKLAKLSPSALNNSVLSMKDPSNKEKKEKSINELENVCNVLDEILKEENEQTFGYENPTMCNKDLIETANKTKDDSGDLILAMIEGDEEKIKDRHDNLKRNINNLIEQLEEDSKIHPENKEKNDKLIEKLKKAMKELDEAVDKNDIELAQQKVKELDELCNLIVEDQGKKVKESESDLKKLKQTVKKARKAEDDRDKEQLKLLEKEMKEDSAKAINSLKKEAISEKDNKKNKVAEDLEKEMKDLSDIDNYSNDMKDNNKKDKCDDKFDKIEDIIDDAITICGGETSKADKYKRKAIKNLEKSRKEVRDNKPKDCIEHVEKSIEDIDKYINELDDNNIGDKAKKEALKQSKKELEESLQKYKKENRNPQNKKDLEKSIENSLDILKNQTDTRREYIEAEIVNAIHSIENVENDAEAIKGLEALDALIDSIILDDNEEIKIIGDDIVRKQRHLDEALKEGDLEKAKEIKESLEKDKEMLEKLRDKLKSKNPDSLEVKEIDKILSMLDSELLQADECIKDNNDINKKKLHEMNVEFAKEEQVMKGVVGGQMAIVADEKMKEIEKDLKELQEAIKQGDEKKIKELTKKLKKDQEDYNNAINVMLQNSDISPSEYNQVLKDLEEIKKKTNKIIEDAENGKNIDEDVKDVMKNIKNIDDILEVGAIAAATQLQNDLDRCKAAINDPKHKEEELNKLKENFRKFKEEMLEAIKNEKDPKKKKEMEEALKKAEKTIEDVIKAFENGDEKEFDKLSKLANIELEKCKELCGSTKSDKASLSKRLELLEDIKNAKTQDEKKNKLKELKDMLSTLQLDDPESLEMIEKLNALIDEALLAEGSDFDLLLDEIVDLNERLGELETPETSQQAQIKNKGKGLKALAKKGKKTSNKSITEAAKMMADSLRNLKNLAKEDVKADIENLSDKAKAALVLDDMLSDINLDGNIDTTEVTEVTEVKEENKINDELNNIANMILETQKVESEAKATGREKKMIKVDMPEVCGDIAVHFRQLAAHACNQNKEGIIVEGRAISAALLKFCKELQIAQPLCRERVTADNMGRSLMSLRNLATQLKILCSVKAGTVGKGDAEADEQLIAMSKTVGAMMKEGMQALSLAKRLNLLTK